VVGEVHVTAGQGEELVCVFFDGPGATEKDQLAQGAIGQWRPESLVDELHEPAPGWSADRELEAHIPELSHAREMHGGVPYPPLLRCALAAEEGLAPIQPRQRVLFPIKLGEFQENSRVEAIIVVVVSFGVLPHDELLPRLAHSILRSPWLLGWVADGVDGGVPVPICSPFVPTQGLLRVDYGEVESADLLDILVRRRCRGSPWPESPPIDLPRGRAAPICPGRPACSPVSPASCPTSW
jgi:hypothetical protein